MDETSPSLRGSRAVRNEISILKVFIHRNGYICGLSQELKRTTNAYEQKPYRFQVEGWRGKLPRFLVAH